MALFKRKQKDKEEQKKVEEKPIGEQAVLPVAPSLPKSGDASSYGIIFSPHITEKGSIMAQLNKYIFKVAGNAGKTEIKKAIEKLYKVNVVRVSVLKTMPKERTVGRFRGKKAGFKKAIVTLKEGSKIDIAQ